MKGFVPLREEAERRGKMIKAASDRKAPPDEACKLIKNFGQAEMKMIHMSRPIPPNAEFRRRSPTSSRTATRTPRRCRSRSATSRSRRQTRGPAGPSLSEVLGSSAALPEAQAVKKGGSTFDTLNGNVLQR